MMNKLTGTIAGGLGLAAVALAGGGLLDFARPARAQVPSATGAPNGGCVSFGTGASLQLCMHEFEDGTRCVAAGSGGFSQDSAGGGAAVECDFARP